MSNCIRITRSTSKHYIQYIVFHKTNDIYIINLCIITFFIVHHGYVRKHNSLGLKTVWCKYCFDSMNQYLNR